MVKNDWLEIRNVGEQSISLEDWMLFDGNRLYRLPGYVIDSFQLVYTKEKMNCGLSKYGETIYLVSPTFQVVDSVSWGPGMVEGQSFGRNCTNSNEWIMYEPGQTTPGATNYCLDTLLVVPDETVEMMVYPNPTTGMLYCRGCDTYVELVDILGRKFKADLQEDLVDLSHLQSGLYLLFSGNKVARVMVTR